MLNNELLNTQRYYIPQMVSPAIVNVSFTWDGTNWTPDADEAISFPGATMVASTVNAVANGLHTIAGLPGKYSAMRIRRKSLLIPGTGAVVPTLVAQSLTDHQAGIYAFTFRNNVAGTPGSIVAPVTGTVFSVSFYWSRGDV